MRVYTGQFTFYPAYPAHPALKVKNLTCGMSGIILGNDIDVGTKMGEP
jgi:hypothetical protein